MKLGLVLFVQPAVTATGTDSGASLPVQIKFPLPDSPFEPIELSSKIRE